MLRITGVMRIMDGEGLEKGVREVTEIRGRGSVDSPSPWLQWNGRGSLCTLL